MWAGSLTCLRLASLLEISALALSGQAKMVETKNEPPVMRDGPALSFGPVPVKGGVAVRVCSMNLSAHRIRLTAGIVKGDRVLATATEPLEPRKLMCLEYPMPNVFAGNIVGLVSTADPEGEKLLRKIASTLQVVQQNGTVDQILNPVLLPEVQLPVGQPPQPALQ